MRTRGIQSEVAKLRQEYAAVARRQLLQAATDTELDLLIDLAERGDVAGQREVYRGIAQRAGIALD